MGGLWEAAVKSFKAHIRKIGGPFKYTFDEFSTLLAPLDPTTTETPLSVVNR